MKTWYKFMVEFQMFTSFKRVKNSVEPGGKLDCRASAVRKRMHFNAITQHSANMFAVLNG